ncbi:MAG: tetratricopeptide repeat protein [Acidobacteriota bacterium]
MLLIYRRVWIVSFVLLSLLVMFISMVTKADQSSPSVQERAYSSTESVVLEQGKPIERELAGSEVHSYKVRLTASQFINVVVEQKGIDVVATLVGVDGKQLMEVDSPNGTQGPEPVLFITEVIGPYRLEVSSLEKTATVGQYEIEIAELRTAITQDKDRIAARRAFAEGVALHARESYESWLKAAEKFEQALLLFQVIGDHKGEANTLKEIGGVYDSLGLKLKSLDYYYKALSIFTAIGNHSKEADTLKEIGQIYDLLENTRNSWITTIKHC